MKKFFKWVGIVLAVLVGLILVVFVFVHSQWGARLTRIYELPGETLRQPVGAF